MKDKMREKGDSLYSEIVWAENDRFWLPLRKQDGGAYRHSGDVLISINLLTTDDSEKYPQGEGR